MRLAQLGTTDMYMAILSFTWNKNLSFSINKIGLVFAINQSLSEWLIIISLGVRKMKGIRS